MAGTAQKVRLSARPGDMLYQIAVSLNQLIDSFDTHTHKTPTSNPGATSTPTSDAGGSGSTGGTAALTAASKIQTENGTTVA